MKTETFVPESKYLTARAIAIFSTFACAVLMIILLATMNEVHRLHQYMQSL